MRRKGIWKYTIQQMIAVTASVIVQWNSGLTLFPFCSQFKIIIAFCDLFWTCFAVLLRVPNIKSRSCCSWQCTHLPWRVSLPCRVAMDTSNSCRGGKNNITVKLLIINVLDGISAIFSFSADQQRCALDFVWINCCCFAVLRVARKANSKMSHEFLKTDY